MHLGISLTKSSSREYTFPSELSNSVFRDSVREDYRWQLKPMFGVEHAEKSQHWTHLQTDHAKPGFAGNIFLNIYPTHRRLRNIMTFFWLSRIKKANVLLDSGVRSECKTVWGW